MLGILLYYALLLCFSYLTVVLLLILFPVLVLAKPHGHVTHLAILGGEHHAGVQLPLVHLAGMS